MIEPIGTAKERHNISKGALDCWCMPRYLLPCDECDTGCWKCDGGSIELTREEAEKVDAPIVIVHQEEEA